MFEKRIVLVGAIVSTLLGGCFKSPVPVGFKPFPPVISPNDLGHDDRDKVNPGHHVVDSNKSRLDDQDAFELVNTVIQVDLNPTAQTFSAHVELNLKQIHPVAANLGLDFSSSLVVDGLALNGVAVTDFRHVGDGLEIVLPPDTSEQIKVEVQYHGAGSKRGLIFSQVNNQVAQAWINSEPVDARQWLPIIDRPDFKAPVEQNITVPKNWNVLANGALISDKVNGDKHTLKWQEKFPLPSYLISFVAGELEVLNADNNQSGFPIQYWVPHEDVAAAKLGFKLTPDMVKYFSSQLIDYPYEKYAIGVAYGFRGAMEHTTATTFSHDLQSQESGMDSAVAAHELAHHWFGDTVTCKTWNDLWLNEGFADFFDVYYWEHVEGSDKRLARMESYKRRYFGEEAPNGNGSLGPIFNPKTSPDEKFTSVNYEKGALVLQNLRYELGDDMFLKSLTQYLNTYKFRSASIEEFKSVVEQTSGVDLTTFFDQWIKSSGYPEITYSWTWDLNHQEVVLHISQTQKAPAARFALKLDLLVEYLDPNGQTVSARKQILTV